MTTQKPIKRRKLTGTVVSDKMQKTVVVRVERLKKHPKYEQRFRVSKKFKAHDETGAYHTGDKVIIEETRPISRDKRWRVIEKIGEDRHLILSKPELESEAESK
ncbi:MAG: 30S ribosomal protein S17 [bacterium]|nr:30S ribosomal protein S17 [bacterium]